MKLYVDVNHNWKKQKNNSNEEEFYFVPFYARFRNIKTIYKGQVCDRHLMLELEVLNFFIRLDLKTFPVIK